MLRTEVSMRLMKLLPPRASEGGRGVSRINGSRTKRKSPRLHSGRVADARLMRSSTSGSRLSLHQHGLDEGQQAVLRAGGVGPLPLPAPVTLDLCRFGQTLGEPLDPEQVARFARSPS